MSLRVFLPKEKEIRNGSTRQTQRKPNRRGMPLAEKRRARRRRLGSAIVEGARADPWRWHTTTIRSGDLTLHNTVECAGEAMQRRRALLTNLSGQNRTQRLIAALVAGAMHAVAFSLNVKTAWYGENFMH